jgi:cell wall-associated NlpC family hydrolase
MLTKDQADAVAREAALWIGTPYHHMGRVKGAGVDCATLLCEVYHAAGIVPRVDLEYYPPDWHMHRDVERYLSHLLSYAEEVDEPQRGGILAVKFGRCYSHGAIVIDWPICIHAMVCHPVVYVDAEAGSIFRDNSGALRPRKFFALR